MKKDQKVPRFIKRCAYKPSSKTLSQDLIRKVEQTSIKAYMSQINTSEKQLINIQKQQLRNFIVLGTAKNQIFTIYHPVLKIFGFIDQHAMHERVRYEYYSRNLQNQTNRLFIQKNIQKNAKKRPTLAKSIMKYKKLMHICKYDLKQQNKKQQYYIDKFGFNVFLKQNGDFYMQQQSQILGRRLDNQTLKKIGIQMLQLQMEKSNRIPKTLDDIVAEHSCKSAIKFGDQVDIEWCLDLLYNASLCDFPWKCVHGRTTAYLKQIQLVQVPRIYTLQ